MSELERSAASIDQQDGNFDAQALIVDAGLTLACDLARRGVRFRIIDKAPAPCAGSRGKGLQPRSLEVLDDLGLVERVLAWGVTHLPFRRLAGQPGHRRPGPHAGRQPTPDVPYPSVVIIPQWRTEQLLRQRLAEFGGHVESATELVGFAQDATGVTATLARGSATEQLRAGFLVGCDGGHSTVRHLLGVGFQGEAWETERMLVGDVEAEGLDREHWHVWPDASGGMVGLCPLPGAAPSSSRPPWQRGLAQGAAGQPARPLGDRLPARLGRVHHAHPGRAWRQRPQRPAGAVRTAHRAGDPHSQLEVYQGAPHGLFLTHADRLNHDLLAFTAQTAPLPLGADG